MSSTTSGVALVFESLSLPLVFLTSAVITTCLLPLTRRFPARWGYVASVDRRRWSQRAIPSTGGIAIFLGSVFPTLAFSPHTSSLYAVLVVGVLMFCLGLYDDLRHLRPATKLACQLVAAGSAIGLGYRLHFFQWTPLDFLLSLLWIVGLTNAINLLDNMDGLAAGISLIAAVYLSCYFLDHEDYPYATMAMALSGALAAFLIRNFHPASIFMGDSGSLFLGILLSMMTIQARGKASNIFSLVAIPTLILLIPIFDTLFVMFTRALRGQPISTGGKDHTSHRLVRLGLREPQAVLLLYLAAAASGAAAILLDRFSYTLGLLLLPFVVLSFTLVTAYLGQVGIPSGDESRHRTVDRRHIAILRALTYKYGIPTMLVDSILVASAYLLAFALRFDFTFQPETIRLYSQSLPFVVVANLFPLFFFGNYRGTWRYTTVEDFLRLAKSVAVGTLLTIASLLFVFRFTGYSRVVAVLHPMLLFLGLAGMRLSFRVFSIFLRNQQAAGIPILIYGADDGGEAAVRECRRNPTVLYEPVGFIDDDALRHGTSMLGLPVLGGLSTIEDSIARTGAQGLIVSSACIAADGRADEIRRRCREQGVWVKYLRLEFVDDR